MGRLVLCRCSTCHHHSSNLFVLRTNSSISRFLGRRICSCLWCHQPHYSYACTYYGANSRDSNRCRFEGNLSTCFLYSDIPSLISVASNFSKLPSTINRAALTDLCFPSIRRNGCPCFHFCSRHRRLTFDHFLLHCRSSKRFHFCTILHVLVQLGCSFAEEEKLDKMQDWNYYELYKLYKLSV